jgi:hypothetical protein
MAADALHYVRHRKWVTGISVRQYFFYKRARRTELSVPGLFYFTLKHMCGSAVLLCSALAEQLQQISAGSFS